MSKSELLVAEQVERADFSLADICSAKPPTVPEAVKRHRKPPEGRVLQGFHEPPPKSVTVREIGLPLVSHLRESAPLKAQALRRTSCQKSQSHQGVPVSGRSIAETNTS